MVNGKPKKILHDNGKQFTSKIFKRFLEHNNIKDKPIPNSYPQLRQGKIEANNKIVKNEFISVEVISSIDEGKQRYDMFVMAYNDKREHGGINRLTHHEMFLQTFQMVLVNLSLHVPFCWSYAMTNIWYNYFP